MSTRLAPDLAGVAKLYTDSLGAHGTAPRGVGWRDEDSHRLRFDRLAELIEADGAAFSVNDLGCGYGALHGYLIAHGHQISRFTGYDISEEMLREARRLVTALEANFVASATLTEEADYSFASGIFNVRLKAGEADWHAHIEATLDDMYAHSRRGFAFNLLTSYVDWREDHLYYGDPGYFFDLCKRRYAPRVTLFHDYPLWEWTIVVRIP